MIEVLIYGFVLALLLVLTAQAAVQPSLPQAAARPPLLSAMVAAEAIAAEMTPASPLTGNH